MGGSGKLGPPYPFEITMTRSDKWLVLIATIIIIGVIIYLKAIVNV